MKGLRRTRAACLAIGLIACAKDPPPGVGVDGGGGADGTGVNPGMRATPFGSHSFAYPAGVIFPSGTPAGRDEAVTRLYDRWKAAYVADGCGGRYVRTNGGTGAKDAITVSEGHGYGMIITALMAGHDPEAQSTFDGFVRVLRQFPSQINRDLMSWAVGANCQPIAGPNSASDGDLDVAFALLLANRQWGSRGAIDYFVEANRVIGAIARSVMNTETNLPLLGDWATSGAFYYAARPSDFMADHFRAFAPVRSRALFTAAVDRIYTTVDRLQTGPGRTTGLVPDFVIGTNSDLRPAPADFLEAPTDGDYSYNSCRVPWRLGTDYVVSGDPRARQALDRLTTFAKGKSGGDPARIAPGYRLDGTPLSMASANGAFVGPFAVAAMIDASHQAWLDALWAWMVEKDLQDYYADSIRLLSMIVVSGNWWAP
ncbi:MAG TPA: glycosyl hydrolase family 8 [Polyangia bacterium]